MNIFNIFADMGAIGWGVVSVLLLLSVYSVGVIIEKYRAFRAARSESQRFLPQFLTCLMADRMEEAVEVSRRHGRSHLARVVMPGVMEWVDHRSADKYRQSVVDAVHRALERSHALTSAEMKKGLGGLATIGSTAPFIGLFGTVVGIIHAFQGIAESGSGGISSVSAGIAEALITTAFGLFVAIPAVMAFNYFTTALERLQVEMANSSAELVDFFLKRVEAAREAR